MATVRCRHPHPAVVGRSGPPHHQRPSALYSQCKLGSVRPMEQCRHRAITMSINGSSSNCRSSNNTGIRGGVSVCSLPRIADFIRDECPVRGLDGSYREQPAPPGAELTDSCVLQVGKGGVSLAFVGCSPCPFPERVTHVLDLQSGPQISIITARLVPSQHARLLR